MEMQWQKGFPVIAKDNTMDGGGESMNGYLDTPCLSEGFWWVNPKGRPLTSIAYPTKDLAPDTEAIAAGEWPTTGSTTGKE